jgi:hypothetical protein
MQLSYPFTFNYSYAVGANGASAQATSSDQQYLVTETTSGSRFPSENAKVDSEVKSADVLHFDPSGNFTGNSGQTSSARDTESNSRGDCFSRSLSAAKGVLTAATSKLGCSP